MKRFLFIFVLAVLLIPHLSFADTIELKSGGKLKGRIIEKTEDHVKFQVSSGTVTFASNDVQNIEDVADQSDDLISEKTTTQEPVSVSKPVKPILNKPTVKTTVTVTQRNAPASSKSRTDLTKEPFVEFVKQFLNIKTIEPIVSRAGNQIQLKIRWASQLNPENLIKWIGAFSLLFLLAFLFSVIILKISVKLAGGNVSFLNALFFELRWFWSRLVIALVAALSFLLISFLFFLISAKIPSTAFVVGTILNVIGAIFSISFLLFLFFFFVNMAEKYLQLSRGRIYLVLILGIVLKIASAVILKTALGPIIVDLARPYLEKA